MTRTAESGARFSIVGTWTNAREVINIFEAVVNQIVGATRAEGLAAAAEVISNAWVDNVMPNMANNYVHSAVDWVDLDSATGPTGTFTRAAPSTGGNAGSSMGPQSALRATKNLLGSARGSRSGRTFLIGPEEANVDEDGIVSASTVATRESDLNDFLNAANISAPVGNVADIRVVVFQWPSLSVAQPAKRVPDPDGVGVAAEVASFSVSRFISSQKRRLGST